MAFLPIEKFIDDALDGVDSEHIQSATDRMFKSAVDLLGAVDNTIKSGVGTRIGYDAYVNLLASKLGCNAIIEELGNRVCNHNLIRKECAICWDRYVERAP